MSSQAAEPAPAAIGDLAADNFTDHNGIAVPPPDQWIVQQRALLAFGRRSNAHPTLPVLLQDAATLVEEVLRADHGGVAQIEGDRIRMTLLGRDRRGFPVVIDQSVSSLDEKQSMVAFALSLSTFLTSENLFEETRFQDTFLASKNMVSAIVLPLYTQGKPFGAIVALSGVRRVFSYDDVTFAETVTHFLSSSIARIIAETKLGEAEAAQTMIRSELERARMLTDETASTIGQMTTILEPATTRSAVETQTFHPTKAVPQGAERRRSARRAYRVPQWIAPFQPGRLPARDDFIEADFYDLSADGCSFYFNRVPESKMLVIALGQNPSLSFFAARVVRTMPLDDSADTRQLIGCEFTTRLHLAPHFLS